MGHFQPVMEWVEDDEDFEDDGFDEDEDRELRELQIVEDCRCGAYRFSKTGKFIHVADCCC